MGINMFKAAIKEQMEKWQIKNANQLSKLAGIDYRTASKVVNTDEDISLLVVGKISKVFGFKGLLEFRKYAMENHSEDKDG